MKAKVKVEKEVNFTQLIVNCGAWYWEDATVNDVEDTDGTLIPCRIGEYWCPIIDIDKGIITNWKEGVKAYVHYKCCDDGEYTLVSDCGHKTTIEGYVPKILDLTNKAYGDYVIMKIDENGKIQNWNNQPDITEFLEEQ